MVTRLLIILFCVYGSAAQSSLSAPENPCKLTQAEIAKLTLYHPPPVYSTTRELPSFSGEGIFKVDISKTGAVTSASVHRGTGIPALDASAIATLKTWRFRPLPPGCKGVLVHIPFDVRHR